MICISRGRSVIGFPGSLIWLKTLMELVFFNTCGEFRCEVLKAQLAKSTLLTSTLVPLGSLRSFEVSSDSKERVGVRKLTGSYRTCSILIKLQLWFLSLQWKTCLRQNCNLGSSPCSEGPVLGQKTLMGMMIYFHLM